MAQARVAQTNTQTNKQTNKNIVMIIPTLPSNQNLTKQLNREEERKKGTEEERKGTKEERKTATLNM